MIRPPPGFTPPDTLLPSTTVFRTQSAGPECADQIPCLRAHAVDEPVDGVPRSDQNRDGHVSPASLGAQQTRDSFAVERVGGESVKGVGRENYESAGLERVLRGGQACGSGICLTARSEENTS